MRKLIVVAALALAGCSSAEVENEIHKAAVLAHAAVAAAQANEGTVEDAEAAIAALAPKTGAAHQAVLDAQAALAAWKRNEGTLDAVKAAVATVVSATASAGQ